MRKKGGEDSDEEQGEEWKSTDSEGGIRLHLLLLARRTANRERDRSVLALATRGGH